MPIDPSISKKVRLFALFDRTGAITKANFVFLKGIDFLSATYSIQEFRMKTLFFGYSNIGSILCQVESTGYSYGEMAILLAG